MSRESLHDLFFNPGEGRNLIDDPEYAGVLDELRVRLLIWMQETSDPLLSGPVPAPPGRSHQRPEPTVGRRSAVWGLRTGLSRRPA